MVIKSNKGQTFVEFTLVFVVLFITATGVYFLYKSAWKTRYELSKEPSVIIPQTVRGGVYKLASEGRYVK